jgi:arylsulfatase A-like enzyme
MIKNVLWISFEDICPRLGCYGDDLAQTPNVDQIAATGRRYSQALSTAPICSPSRASIISGMYAPAIGCQHMRTSRVTEAFPDLPTPYEAVPPSPVKAFTEYLRAAGWFCTNNGKHDYQFGQPSSAWDLQGHCIGSIDDDAGQEHLQSVHWRRRHDPDQPFFAVFNLGWSHESCQWADKAGRVPAVTDPDQVVLPPYLPDTPVSRQALAQQYDSIAHNDRIVGELLRQLEADGHADDTAIFIWSDHSEGLPRRKSWPYFSGCHVPLIIKAPGMEAATVDSITSLVDLGPTVLSVLGLPIPCHMQGRPLLDRNLQPTEARSVAFGHRDRTGESYDRIRSAFTDRFSYIRNDYPQNGRGPIQAYRHQHPIFQELYRLDRDGALTPEQRWLFAENRPPEELYDRSNDPHELINLADDPTYQNTLAELRAATQDWDRELGFLSSIDEEQMVRFWYPDGTQPITSAPVAMPISADHDGTRHSTGSTIEASGPLRLIIQCGDQGASVEVSVDGGPWLLKTSALNLEPGRYDVRARAIRYGWKESVESRWEVVVS